MEQDLPDRGADAARRGGRPERDAGRAHAAFARVERHGDGLCEHPRELGELFLVALGDGLDAVRALGRVEREARAPPRRGARPLEAIDGLVREDELALEAAELRAVGAEAQPSAARAHGAAQLDGGLRRRVREVVERVRPDQLGAWARRRPQRAPGLGPRTGRRPIGELEEDRPRRPRVRRRQREREADRARHARDEDLAHLGERDVDARTRARHEAGALARGAGQRAREGGPELEERVDERAPARAIARAARGVRKQQQPVGREDREPAEALGGVGLAEQAADGDVTHLLVLAEIARHFGRDRPDAEAPAAPRIHEGVISHAARRGNAARHRAAMLASVRPALAWICALCLGWSAAEAAPAAAQDWGLTRPEGGRPSRGRPARSNRPRAPRPATAPAARPPERAPEDGRAEQLIERYFAVLASDPRESFAWERLLDLYRERDGNLDGLTAELERRAAAAGAGYAPHMLLGHLRKAQNALEEARASYARAAEANASTPDPLVAMARLDRAQGRLPAARALVDRALPLVTGREARAELLREAGQMALDAEDYVAASRYYADVARFADGSVYVATELARALSERGRHEIAIAEYERVVHSLRGDNRVLSPVLRDMARAQLEAGRVDDAISTLRRALRLAGQGSGTAAEIYEVMGEAYRRSGRLDVLVRELDALDAGDFQRSELAGRLHDELGHEAEALAAYRRALRLSPRDIDTRVRVVQLLARSGRMDEVIVEYRALIAAAPREPRFVVELAQMLLEVGRREEAIALADRTSRGHPRDVATHRALAELYGRFGEQARAAREIALLARIDAQDPANLVALGAQQLAEGHRDAAIATFRRILGAVRDRGEAHATLAGVFADHDMPDLAEQEYRLAVEADADEARHLRGLAEVLERPRQGETQSDRQRRDVEAVATWQKVLERSGDDRAARREARRRIVGVWERRGQLRERVAEWERAFAATPPNAEAGRFVAEAKLRARPPDTRAALAILARLAEIEPGDVESLIALERARTAAGDRAGAIDVLRRLVEADPRRAPHYLERMAEHAHALYRDDDAVRYAEEAVRRSPDDGEGHRRLGDLYRSRQDFDRAVASYGRAIERNDRLFSTYFDLAEIHVAAGRLAEADRLYRQVLRLCPDDDLVARAGRASMQIALGAATLEALERDLLPLALANPRRPIFRRMLVELYDDMTAPLVADLGLGGDRAPAARAALDGLGRRALKPLLEALADDDPDQQRVAVDVLGYLQNPNAAGPLLAAAEAEGPLDLRARALGAAGALAGESHLPRFDAIARGSERRLRAIATWAIARIGGRRALPMLRVLRDHADPDVRAFAVLGLGAEGDRASAEALRRMLSDDRQRVVQESAAWALGFVGGEADVPVLVHALANGQGRVRAASALALGRIGRAESRAALAEALFDPNPSERAAALVALERLSGGARAERAELPLAGARTTASSYLELLLNAPPSGTIALEGPMVEVFTGAAREALRGPIERLLAALRLLTGRETAAQIALAEGGRAELLAALGADVIAVADHPSPEARALAVALLAELTTPEARALLGAKLDDPSPDVVRAVLERIGRAHAGGPLVGRMADIARGHEDWAMRRAAASALGRVDPEAATPTLVAVARGDRYAFVREAALRALGFARNPQARAALAAAATADEDARVRSAAEDALASARSAN